MKTWIVGFIGVLMGVSMASAFNGLPVGETAQAPAGEIGVTAAATLQSDMNLYGVRAHYNVLEGLSGFVGGGWLTPDAGDSSFYLQLGAKYALPVTLPVPVDLAVRGAAGMTGFDSEVFGEKVESDLWTINGGLLAGMNVLDRLDVYAFGGLQYWSTEVTSGHHSLSESDVEIALAGGAQYEVLENLALFAEVAIIDEFFVGAGATYTFGQF